MVKTDFELNFETVLILLSAHLTGSLSAVLGRLITVFLKVFLQSLDVCSDLLFHHLTGLDEVAHLPLPCFVLCRLFLDLSLYVNTQVVISKLCQRLTMYVIILLHHKTCMNDNFITDIYVTIKERTYFGYQT